MCSRYSAGTLPAIAPPLKDKSSAVILWFAAPERIPQSSAITTIIGERIATIAQPIPVRSLSSLNAIAAALAIKTGFTIYYHHHRIEKWFSCSDLFSISMRILSAVFSMASFKILTSNPAVL
ncbi:hypothetical protein SDC9_202802 [bioreactor metagenome]|uniref:Uncharacterized protein n=1 Tax=bioreactor metagenome TaxID=1076179 RepID=A0A645J6L9_9ZZZZ